MELRLVREPTREGVTLGVLFLDGSFCGFTCEDPIREDSRPVEAWKIAGDTAIPQGRYRVILSQSVRFGRLLPEVLGVPGFTGVRIHRGNTPADSRGCPLVGTGRTAHGVTGSAVAEVKLVERLRAATGPIWLTVENPEPLTDISGHVIDCGE